METSGNATSKMPRFHIFVPIRPGAVPIHPGAVPASGFWSLVLLAQPRFQAFATTSISIFASGSKGWEWCYTVPRCLWNRAWVEAITYCKSRTGRRGKFGKCRNTTSFQEQVYSHYHVATSLMPRPSSSQVNQTRSFTAWALVNHYEQLISKQRQGNAHDS